MEQLFIDIFLPVFISLDIYRSSSKYYYRTAMFARCIRCECSISDGNLNFQLIS